MSFFSFIIGLIAGAGSYYLYEGIEYRKRNAWRGSADKAKYKPAEITKEPLWFVEPSTANGEFIKFTEAEPYKVAVKFRD